MGRRDCIAGDNESETMEDALRRIVIFTPLQVDHLSHALYLYPDTPPS
jgi:hypothetical protein